MQLQRIIEELVEENSNEVLATNGNRRENGRPGRSPLRPDGALELNNVPIDDQVGLYFYDMRQERLLTAEEEVQLAQEIEAGLQAARRLEEGATAEDEPWLARAKEIGSSSRARLIQANMRLVVSIAKRYRAHGMPFLGLIQEGNIGLIKAVEKYDYRLGNRFSTYATWWIRQAVSRALANQGRTIRIPAHLVGRITKIYRTTQELGQQLGRPPTIAEMAEVTEMDVDEISWLLEISRWPVSLELPVGDDPDGSELGDFIEDREAEEPADLAGRSMMRQQIDEILDQLPPRQALILRLRYGLQDGQVRTLKEVGSMFGLSRERIRQLEKEAMGQLRAPSLTAHLRLYLE